MLRAKREILSLTFFGILGIALITFFLTETLKQTPLGFPFDDSWIHLQFAKNLILNRELSFNPGELSSGTSSYFWVFLLSSLGWLNYIWLPQISIALGILFYLLFIFLCYRLAHKLSFQTTTARFLTLFMLTSSLLIFWSLAGLETTAFLFLSTLSIYLLSQEKYQTASLAFSLLFLIRPESLVFYPVVLLYFLFRNRFRLLGLFHSRLFWLPLLSVLLFIFLNIFVSRSLINTTFLGRRLLWVGPNVPYDFSRASTFLRMWFNFLRKSFVDYPLAQVSLNETLERFLPKILTSVVIFGALIFLKEIIFKKNRFLLLFALWVTVHNLFYIYFLPTRGHLGRYQPENFLLVFLIFFLAVEFLQRQQLFLAKVFAFTLSLFLISLNLLGLSFWQRIYTLSVRHINEIHVELGKFINQQTPRDAKIAAYDIGAISYFAERPIVDLSCLTDKSCIRYREQNQMAYYLLDKEAVYLAMPELSETHDFFPGLYQQLEDLGVERKRVKTFNFGTWEDNIVTWNAFPQLGFYRLVSSGGVLE